MGVMRDELTSSISKTLNKTRKRMKKKNDLNALFLTSVVILINDA